MMKKNLLLILIFLAGCSLIPTPDDFPSPPPMTPIVEWPQVTATTTIEPNLRPILPKSRFLPVLFDWTKDLIERRSQVTDGCGLR